MQLMQGGGTSADGHLAALLGLGANVEELQGNQGKSLSTDSRIILHGEKDSKAPGSQSETLRDRYQALGLEAHLYIKPGAGHGWTKSDDEERELVLATLKRWFKKSEARP
jgi:dienelactone hydrolase